MMGPWYDTASEYSEQSQKTAGKQRPDFNPHPVRTRMSLEAPGPFVTYALLTLMIVSQAAVL